MSTEGFQPFKSVEKGELKRGDKIQLRDDEVHTTSEETPFPTYLIREKIYIALPMQIVWENFSTFPTLEKNDTFLAGNKNLELDVFDGDELNLDNQNKWDHISPENAVILLPFETVKDVIRELSVD